MNRLEEEDIQERLRARRTRLLAFLSFFFSVLIDDNNNISICRIVFSEQDIRGMNALIPWINAIANKPIPNDKVRDINIALGHIAHLVLLLSRYFNVCWIDKRRE